MKQSNSNSNENLQNEIISKEELKKTNQYFGANRPIFVFCNLKENAQLLTIPWISRSERD